MEINATFLVSIISFILFMVIMDRILYKPILSIMRKRADYIQQNEDIVASNKNEGESLLKQKQEKLSDTKSKSKELLTSSVEEAKAEQQNTVSSAKSEANEKLENYYSELANEKVQIQQDLDNEIENLSNLISSKIVDKVHSHSGGND